MSKLKVYGGMFDGRNYLVVAAKNFTEAARAFGVSAHQCRAYGSATRNTAALEAALSKPGTVFVESLRYSGNYVEGNGR